MNYGLPQEVIEKIQTVFQSFPAINKVVLYGSRAQGNYKPGSDVDLVVKESSIDFQTCGRVSAALEALHTPYTFDLSIFEKLESPPLVEHIERVGKVFYSKK